MQAGRYPHTVLGGLPIADKRQALRGLVGVETTVFGILSYDEGDESIEGCHRYWRKRAIAEMLTYATRCGWS